MKRGAVTAALGLGAMLLGGCQESLAPEPSMTPADSVLTQMTRWPERFSPILMRVGRFPRLALCGPHALTGELICPPVTGSDLRLWVQVHFEDAQYQRQTAFDHATTEWVTLSWTVIGNPPSGDATSSISATGLIGVQGLLSDAPVLGGHTSVTTWWGLRANNGSVTTDMTISRLALPRDETGYPGAGTITLNHHGPGYMDTGPIDLQMVLTFNGSPIVAVQRTEHGVTRNCTWDLTPRNPEMGNGLTCD